MTFRLPLPDKKFIPTRTMTDRLPGVPSRQDQHEALQAAGQVFADNYDLLFQLGSILTAVLGHVYEVPAQTANYAAQAYVDSAKGLEAKDASLDKKRNPLFAKYGIGENAENSVTKRYLTTRRWKKVGGSVAQLTGNLMSLAPTNLHLNPIGIAYHGQATALTGVHMAMLQDQMRRNAADSDLRDWIILLQEAKALKLAARGGQLIGSAIPAASMPTSIAAAAIKAGIKMTFAGACYAIAAKLHWRAYVEQEKPRLPAPPPPPPQPAPRLPSLPRGLGDFKVDFPEFDPRGNPIRTPSRPGSPMPPPSPAPTPRSSVNSLPSTRNASAASPSSFNNDAAIQVVREIFTKRGATRLFGPYDVQAMIREPAGWLAIADKLLLI